MIYLLYQKLVIITSIFHEFFIPSSLILPLCDQFHAFASWSLKHLNRHLILHETLFYSFKKAEDWAVKSEGR